MSCIFLMALLAFSDLFKIAKAKFKNINIVVNNAGILNEKLWEKTVDTNLVIHFDLFKLWLTHVLLVPSGQMTFMQRHINVDTASWRCIYVDTTLSLRHVPVGYKQRANDARATSYQRSASWRYIDIDATLLKRHGSTGYLYLYFSHFVQIIETALCLRYNVRWTFFRLVFHIMFQLS